jgi:hypothetical protein
MKRSNHKITPAGLCLSGLLAASSLQIVAQTPGTLPYYAEMGINKERLWSVWQYELAKTMVPTQHHARADFYINHVRTGHQHEYEVNLSVRLSAGSASRPTNVCLTFPPPDGQTRCATLNAENDLEFPNWTNRVYSFAELKAILPPGPYHLVAFFPEGAGTNYTAVLPDYTDDSFPQFISGVLTWAGASDAPLTLQWDTTPDADEYEVWAGVFPIGPEVYYNPSVFPTYPERVTNVLAGTKVNTNFYSVYIEAERDVDSGDFHHEFSSYTDFHFLPARLANPIRAVGGSFECDVFGGNGTSYLIQCSTHLVGWTPLNVGTVRNNGGFRFTDSAAVTLPRRFYRALWSPAP